MSGPLRVIHVSDLHLASTNEGLREQAGASAWERFVDRVALSTAAAIVVTGDIVIDDPDSEADHEHAQRCLGALGIPVFTVPGNHDVGDHATRGGLPPDWHGTLVTQDRVERWEKRWGKAHWVHAIDDWRLIGLNSQIFDSGTPAETEQWDWIEHVAVPSVQGHPVIVFMHEGLDARPSGAPKEAWMTIPETSAARLRTLFERVDVLSVSSGHTHRYQDSEVSGIRQITAPSLVSPIPAREDMFQPDGDGRPGWLEYTLGDRQLQIERMLSDVGEGVVASATEA